MMIDRLDVYEEADESGRDNDNAAEEKNVGF